MSGEITGGSAAESATRTAIRLLKAHRKENDMPEMPRYLCHKTVHALKIKAVKNPGRPEDESDGSVLLVMEDDRFGPLKVDHDYFRKHNPQAGGYYVVYEDGYKSYSPAGPFESGYTQIDA